MQQHLHRASQAAYTVSSVMDGVWLPWCYHDAFKGPYFLGHSQAKMKCNASLHPAKSQQECAPRLCSPGLRINLMRRAGWRVTVQGAGWRTAKCGPPVLPAHGVYALGRHRAPLSDCKLAAMGTHVQEVAIKPYCRRPANWHPRGNGHSMPSGGKSSRVFFHRSAAM